MPHEQGPAYSTEGGTRMGRPLRRVRLRLIRRAVLTLLTIIISMEFYVGGKLSNEVMGRLWLPFLSDRLEMA